MITVAIDVGTTTTHLVVHRLDPGDPTVGEGRFRPRHQCLYESPICFTPRLSPQLLAIDALVELHRSALAIAGWGPSQLDLGVVLITGEAARCQNAAEAVHALGSLCRSSVAAMAGGHAESRLSGRGSGAQRDSEQRVRHTLCLDIGGGTTNVSRFAYGQEVATANVLVGGRMVRFGPRQEVLSMSPLAQKLAEREDISCPIGHILSECERTRLAEAAAQVVHAAVLGQPLPSDHFETSWSAPPPSHLPDAVFVVGGVGSLFHHSEIATPDIFCDLGVDLARALRKILPTTLVYPPSPHSIRATVVGTGEHAVLLGGASFHDDRAKPTPLQGLPLVRFPEQPLSDGPFAWYLDCPASTPFAQLRAWAHGMIERAYAQRATLVVAVLSSDLGKAFSVALRLEAKALGYAPETLCLDCLPLADATLLDIGTALPNGAIPVLARTLEFG